jgi:hypothetical protein
VDMARVSSSYTGTSGSSIEFYGNKFQISYEGDGLLRVVPPSYVKSLAQVAVNTTKPFLTVTQDPNGDILINFRNPNQGGGATDAQVITIAFRG